MAKSPDEMTESMVANLKEKTGKTLAQWLKTVSKAQIAKHGELVKHLKTEHGVTHGYANLIAHKALKSDAGSAADETDLVRLQYSGAKEALRPIYDALMKRIKTFGQDVEIAPKKTYVSLRRKKQFAIIQPSTKTRVDVGINLKSANSGDRLEKSGSFNAMVSHRVRLADPREVDSELEDWLRQAYQQAQ